MNPTGPCYDCSYIVDDDAVITMIHTAILKKHRISAEIKTFRDASMALKHLETEISGEPKSILILLDINMPEMSGFEFLEHTQNLDNAEVQLDIFMITSSIDPEECHRGMSYPLVRKFITKPFSGQVLTDFIAMYGSVSA
ncbi:MAG: response regulator [Arenibacter algicola]|nr:response regulator [Arenibacter algicola]